MSNIYLILPFLLLMCSCVTTRPLSDGPKIVSLKSDFETSFAPHEEKGASFYERNQTVYENFVYPELASDSAKTIERQQRLVVFLGQSSSNYSGILRTFDDLAATSPSHIRKFKQLFPKADFGYSIYFLPSLLWFSGRAGFTDEKSVIVAFGVDNIYKNKENVSVLFPHEMFHALHYKTLKLSRSQAKTLESELLPSMWFEGLASYVSGIVSGVGTSPSAIFGKLGSQCEDSKQRIIHEFLSDLKKPRPMNDAIANAWFGSGDVDRRLPPMAGYCVGVWGVTNLAKTHDLETLISWNPVLNPDLISSAVVGALK